MIFSMPRAFQGADSSAKLNGRLAPVEILAVIGDETVERKIDFPDQHAGIEFIDHAPHLGDHLVDFRLVGGIPRQDFLVRRPSVAKSRIGRIVAKLLHP